MYASVNRVSLGWDKGLSPHRRQAIILKCWVIINQSLKNKLKLHFNQNTKPFLHENPSEDIVCEMAAVLSRERYVNEWSAHRIPSLWGIIPIIEKSLDLIWHWLPIQQFTSGFWPNESHHVDGHYRQFFDIRRTTSQHLKYSRSVLRLSLPNLLKPDVKSRMKM